MAKEMVIAANRHETKLAILEDDQLVEVYFQRANEYSLAGSIHKGRVMRVLPGMQSAFVDLGLERDTFLYVSDFFEENEEYDRIGGAREERGGREERGREERGREERGREDRPKDERPGRERPHEEAEAEPAAVEAVAAANGAAHGGAAPEGTERNERGDRGDRDDRRRRGRKRRRGREFPDSKYARPERTPEQSGAPAVEAPVREPAAAESEDFSVLPGESLAKYRHTTVSTLDAGEQEEAGAAPPELEQVADEAQPDADAADADENTATAEMDDISSDGLLTDETIDELQELEPLAGGSDVDEIDELVDQAYAEAAEADAASPAEEADTESVEPEAAAVAEAPNAGEAGEPASGVATVREQGGRYLHRTSRRMRRKMRSQQGRGEAAPAEPARAAEAPQAERERPQRERPERDRAERERPERAPERTVVRPETGQPLISDLLKEGQEIIVQIAKEPLGQKGARITSHIALPGRYVVYMPTLDHMGVSRKIASDDERLRLKKILQTHRAGLPGGFIVRTAGEGHTEDEIAADMNFLFNLWLDIREKAEKRPAPVLLYHDLDLVQRVLRDQLTAQYKAIWVDNEEMYESVLRFVQRFQPSLVTRVKLYTRPQPTFDAFNITPELEKALRPKVWLKSGGYIVINQTEALVAIDVNTGKYVGKSNRLEDTIVKTNLEAVKEIVRQVRLRDLGGIIVVDFIDMDERKNRQKVMQALEEAMRADKAPNKILQFNDFGLVAITRKRVKQSLERALCAPCPYCEGAGYVKSVQTIMGEILQEAHKLAPAIENGNVILRANPEVAKAFKSNQNTYLEELETILRRPVLVKSDPLLHHEKFDLA